MESSSIDNIPEGFELESPEAMNMEDWELETQSEWQDKLPTFDLKPIGKYAARAVKGAASVTPPALLLQLYDMLPPKYKAKMLDINGGIPASAAFVKPGEEISKAYDKLTGLEESPSDPIERQIQSFSEYLNLIKSAPAQGISGAQNILRQIGKSLGLTAGEEITREIGGEEFVPGYKLAAPLSVIAGSSLAKGRQPKGQSTLQTSIEKNPELSRRYNYGRALGMTEEELTPMLQSQEKQRTLEPFTRTSRQGQEAIAKSREALGRNYRRLEQQGANISVPQTTSQQLITEMGQLRNNLTQPHIVGPDSEAIINRIDQGIQSIVKNPGNAQQLIQTYRELNSIPNWRSMTDGRRRLSEVRTMFRDALRQTDPRIAQEFELTNSMYQNLMDNSRALSANTAPLIHDGTNINPILMGFAFDGIEGGTKAAKGLAWYQGLNRLATELLVNPKLQGLHRNILRSLNQTDPNFKVKVFKDLMKWLERDYPEEALKIHESNNG